jgi:molybdopterin synthase sulfur carrier subunit
MRWKLFATLAETAGTDSVTVSVEADDPTLQAAFDALLASHPELESDVLDEEGDLYDHIRLLCDGADPFREREGWETTVPDAELALFPPVSGG